MIRALIFNSMFLLFVVLFYTFSDSYLAFLLFAVTIFLYLFAFVFMFTFKNKVDITIDSSSSVYKNPRGNFHVHLENRSLLPITKLRYEVQTCNVLIDEQTSDDFYMAVNGKSGISIPVSVKSNSA